MTNYRRRRRPQLPFKPKNKVNEQIRYPQVRVISEDDFLGIMTSAEALRMADEMDSDLVEINPKAEPPVVKILDYNKFKYQLSKSDKTKVKPQKNKTIRVSVRIGPHDLAVQAKKCDEFLEKGFPVKLQVQMKGREKAHPEVAEEVIISFLSLITKEFIYLQEAKQIGDSYYASVKPK
jgi:translation initiation factor IF-3